MIPTRIILHCSATKNLQHCPAETIRKWHLDRGFKDIGYHAVVQPSGQIEDYGTGVGRALNVSGAHCAGQNSDSLGICMVGDDKFTRRAFDALSDYIHGLRMTYDIPYHRIFAHNEFTDKKTCPNMRITDVVAWLISESYDPILPYLDKTPYY